MNTESAFPLVVESYRYIFDSGMSLRDYFAAKAMQTLVQGYADCDPKHFEITADVSYKMADAMLKARQQ